MQVNMFGGYKTLSMLSTSLIYISLRYEILMFLKVNDKYMYWTIFIAQ